MNYWMIIYAGITWLPYAKALSGVAGGGRKAHGTRSGIFFVELVTTGMHVPCERERGNRR